MSRAVLDVLRKAGGEPLSAKEIASRIIAERGLNGGDRALVRNMNKRVDVALRYQRTNGIVNDALRERGEVVTSGIMIAAPVLRSGQIAPNR